MTGPGPTKEEKGVLILILLSGVAGEVVKVLDVVLVEDRMEVKLNGATKNLFPLVVVDVRCLKGMECWRLHSRQCSSEEVSQSQTHTVLTCSL